jgi:hypothetical protein
VTIGWSELLSTLEGVSDAGSGFVSSLSMRSSIINAGLGMGISKTQILGGMRSVRLGMRTQNFYNLASQLENETDEGGMLDYGGPGAAFDESQVTQMAGGSAGTYTVNVRSYYAITDEDGDIETGYRTTSIKQYGELDIDQAINDARQLQQQSTDAEYPLGTITAMGVSSVVQWQGK